MQDLVTIIIPVYNAQQYLSMCLDSILAQTYKNIEIICVDDGSTDGTLEILSNYQQKDHRIQTIHQEHCFAGCARNIAISNAKGKYIYIMDADDYCEHTLLEYALDAIRIHHADMVVFDYDIIDQSTGTVTRASACNDKLLTNASNCFSWKDVPDSICQMVGNAPWMKLYRADYIKMHFKFDSIQASNDITFSQLSILSANRIYHLKKCLYHYRLFAKGSITSGNKTNTTDIFYALRSCVKQLQQKSNYNMIYQSLCEYCIGQIVYNLKTFMFNSESSICNQFYIAARSYCCNEPFLEHFNPLLIKNKSLQDTYYAIICCDSLDNMITIDTKVKNMRDLLLHDTDPLLIQILHLCSRRLKRTLIWRKGREYKVKLFKC